MILLKESLMQSSGTITPSLSESHKMGSLKNVTGSGGQKINFNNLEQASKRDEFLERQMKDGHFKGLNKLFKHDDSTVMRHPGLVGPSVPPGGSKKKNLGQSKQSKKKHQELDENGNPVERPHDGKHVD